MTHGRDSFVLQKKSRKKSVVGDIFVCKLSYVEEFFFGMVISDNPKYARDWPPEPDLRLLYFYKAQSRDKMQIPSLKSDQLLISPVVIARQAWSYGYFETVGHKEVEPEDYCQTSFWKEERERFYTVDWRSNVWTEVSPPVSGWVTLGISSALGIESSICEALKLPNP